MKHNFISQRSFSVSGLLAGLFLVLLTVALALIGSAAISKAFGEVKPATGSTQGAPLNASASSKNVALSDNPNCCQDKKGNRANGIASGVSVRSQHRVRLPVGSGVWTSLGPPGGDVFDAAVSTLDPNIALAGLAPGGSFGGTLYRSSDAGNTWSEIQPLNGVSVFDIEFAPDGMLTWVPGQR